MCWHCDLGDQLTAMAEQEPDETESDALLCMAAEQYERCECE
jgi:hypothetical protein